MKKSTIALGSLGVVTAVAVPATILLVLRAKKKESATKTDKKQPTKTVPKQGRENPTETPKTNGNNLGVKAKIKPIDLQRTDIFELKEEWLKMLNDATKLNAKKATYVDSLKIFAQNKSITGSILLNFKTTLGAALDVIGIEPNKEVSIEMIPPIDLEKINQTKILVNGINIKPIDKLLELFKEMLKVHQNGAPEVQGQKQKEPTPALPISAPTSTTQDSSTVIQDAQDTYKFERIDPPTTNTESKTTPIETTIPPVQQPQPLVQQPKLIVQQPQPSVQQPKLITQQPQPPVQQPKLVTQQHQPPVQQPQPPVQQPTNAKVHLTQPQNNILKSQKLPQDLLDKLNGIVKWNILSATYTKEVKTINGLKEQDITLKFKTTKGDNLDGAGIAAMQDIVFVFKIKDSNIDVYINTHPLSNTGPKVMQVINDVIKKL